MVSRETLDYLDYATAVLGVSSPLVSWDLPNEIQARASTVKLSGFRVLQAGQGPFGVICNSTDGVVPAMLVKILDALGVSPRAIPILGWEHEAQAAQPLIQSLNLRWVVSFGYSELDGLVSQPQANRREQWGPCQTLVTDDLGALGQTADRKKQVWRDLKMFYQDYQGSKE